ncbi:hypothetical protein N7X57_01140 [Lactiplantibacillus paraplantarum]|uniref:hypothetical protein n=1 Tax=Lactiplantibacillus paraplantarum TaxID=60520 RepID=UPI000513C7F7|nr:hypothetical protein [Lactiplantibacillus paraplantarum]OAX76198.1 hypothetical protein A0U96_03875 [Lactiplantibacillus plantarum]ALO03150.1 hypothetical protein ASU28_01625 [Lactiplantibacillus paraplantarum]KGE76073.1 hypothetical protein HR47_03350 [Lactiplantibacillus paraplantarum]MCW1909075.1 hypothetical protein [Lactiplantibacillus paraplantarum]RDG10491.1 hypothetical protein DQM08_11095 [Lactiplantibacillus paraplantarum]
MKKLIWALRIGIVLFGACLVWEQVQVNRQEASHQRTNHQRQLRSGTTTTFRAVRQTRLSDFSATKVEAAQVWLQMKGTRVINEATPLHIRKISAGQRIQPDDPHSAVYSRQMTQVYSDDWQDANNSVIYTRNADNTVSVTHGRSVQRLPGAMATRDTHSLRPVQTMTISAKPSATLLKVVQLII